MVTKLPDEWFCVVFLQLLKGIGWEEMDESNRGSCHIQRLGDVIGEKNNWLDDSQLEMLVWGFSLRVYAQ